MESCATLTQAQSGTGLVIGSGTALARAGPVGMLLGYVCVLPAPAGGTR